MHPCAARANRPRPATARHPQAVQLINRLTLELNVHDAMRSVRQVRRQRRRRTVPASCDGALTAACSDAAACAQRSSLLLHRMSRIVGVCNCAYHGP